jgi:CelD/BcsL family acetyltransferase involved in cellulose biosynthesis
MRDDADVSKFLSHRPDLGRSRGAEPARSVRLTRFDDWEAYLNTLSHGLQVNQRKQWRRLEKLAIPARFEIVYDRTARLDLVRWLHAEKTRWLDAKGEPGGGMFGTENYRDFLCTIVSVLATKNMVMTCRLVSGEETLSGLLGFMHRGYFVFFIFAYEQEWANYSPGRLLMAKAIEWCMQNDIHTFDMLWGEQEYKLLWCDAEHGIGDYFVPLTVEGRVIEAWHGSGLSRAFAQPWFDAISRHSPAILRRIVGSRLGSNAELISSMCSRNETIASHANRHKERPLA